MTRVSPLTPDYFISLYLVSKTNRRDVFHGLFRYLERLIQTISIPLKGLSEHVIETIRRRRTRKTYINPYTDFGIHNLYRLLERPKALQDRVFQKLFDQAEIAKYSETERRQYEESKKIFWDNYSVITTAHKKGLVEGRIETARKMKADNLDTELIIKYTGLSADEIEAL